jgi:hypothetical protein
LTTRIFLSHAAADAALVEAFETLLCKMTGLASSNVFCSSLEGQGVQKGSNFVDHIKGEVEKADAVVALITPAYLDSAFCMAELGAAWVLGTHRFPIVVPPVGFAAIDATQLGLTAVKLDNHDALAQLFDDLVKALALKAPKPGVQRRALTGFDDAWASIKPGLAPGQRVSRPEYEAVETARAELSDALEEADAEIEKLEAQVAELREAKDAEAVAKIDAKFADTNLQDEFDGLVERVLDLTDDLGGWAVLQHAILDHYDRAGTIDWQSDGSAFETAVQHGIFDPDDNSLKWSADELSALRRLLGDIEAFLLEHHDAAFLTDDDRKGPADIRFWRNR